MYTKLIQKYVENLTTKDLEMFAKKNNISYTEKELNIVYQFIKERYQELLDQNIKVFEEIRDKISPNLYKTLLEYYIEYKQKYL
ncbi:MAG: DUF2624 family protein [Bacilli bacterium]|nr:DUF2624 family protein [Bacilli bacterium]